MSSVYRYEEIVGFTPPSPETFAQEVGAVRQDLRRLHEQGLLTGGLIMGSATSDPSTRSDIDVTVAATQISPELLAGIAAMQRGVRERSGIPVDPLCFTEDQLRSGEHPISETEIAWFRLLGDRLPENVIGTNPFQMMQSNGHDPLEDADAYFTRYAMRLEQTARDASAAPEGLLEAILNAPHKLGRLGVGTLVYAGRLPRATLMSTNKADIARAVSETFGTNDPAVAALYADLTAASSAYTKLVEEVREGRVDQAAYEQLVTAAINDGLPKALALAVKMQAAYRSHLA
jgi:hypothetical protein